MPHLLHYPLTYLVYPTFGKQDPGHGVLKKLIGETMAKVIIYFMKIIMSLYQLNIAANSYLCNP